MLLLQLVQTSAELSGTRSRREKIGHLARCLAQLPSAEVRVGVAFLAGELRQGRIGIGYAAVRTLEASPAAEPSLSLLEVDAAFEAVVALKGPGSAASREHILGQLVLRATQAEQDFLRRLLLGELRQGALEGLMVEGVAKAYGVAAASVRRALMMSADLGAVALAAHERGEPALAEFGLQMFRPLQPMLAQTASSVSDALAQLAGPAFDLKLDGARVQLHRLDDEVRVFSRQQNDVTASVPELVEAALALPARAFVLDGEAIAIDEGDRPYPFQVTMRRFGRRVDIDARRRELPLSCFVFDVLHLDGTDTMLLPASERSRALGDLVGAASDPERAARSDAPRLLPVPRIVARDLAEAEAFFEGALRAGHEGVVAKALDAAYEAGRRGGSWLKIKRALTLDLVILAAEWGSGRRRGFLSNLHLGARGGAGEFVMLGKTFKGMTDQMLAFQTQELLAREIAREGHIVHVRPELVVEVGFDGLQSSPHYPGGFALRFARIKAYRPDKSADQADTIETVQRLAKR